MKHIVLATSDLCTGCSACTNVCPTSSIKMVCNKYGFLQPELSTRNCIECHACERVCPILNSREDGFNNQLEVISAYLKDKEILKKSTSGGAFFCFASKIIEEGGVVFGAKFDEICVIHDYTETLEGLYSFMGSKYIQSDLSKVYKKIKQLLSEGRTVLFSGTPCQVAGLNHYIGNKRTNLITIELLCRGVPSPLVWEKYIKAKMADLNAEEIIGLKFRTKSEFHRSPVPTYSLTFSYKDKYGTWKDFCEDCLSNPYYSYFRNHVFRPSCLRCRFRNTYNSGADISIGDAIVSTENGHESNESTIVLHTRVAHNIWDEVKSKMIAISLEKKDIDSFYNGALYLQKKDRVLKFLKLSNILALKFPLEKVRFVWEFSLINHRIISLFNKVFQTSF